MTSNDIKINTLEVQFKTMIEQNKQDKQDIKEELYALKSDIGGLSTKLDEIIDRMDKRYAPIWVKNVMVWGGGIVGTSLILYVIEVLFIR